MCSQGELPIPTGDGCVCDHHLPYCAGVHRYPGKPHHIVTIENLWRVEGTGECVSGDVCCGTTIPRGDTDVRTYALGVLARACPDVEANPANCHHCPTLNTVHSVVEYNPIFLYKAPV